MLKASVLCRSVGGKFASLTRIFTGLAVRREEQKLQQNRREPISDSEEGRCETELFQGRNLGRSYEEVSIKGQKRIATRKEATWLKDL